MADTPVTEREIVVQRVIHATPEDVFAALSDPQHLAHWWGAHGFVATTRSFDFEPGGVWEFSLLGADDTSHDIRLEWQDIVPHERVAYRRASRPDDPRATVTRLSIEPVANGSEVRFQTVFASRDERLVRETAETKHIDESLERLDTYLTDHTGDTP